MERSHWLLSLSRWVVSLISYRWGNKSQKNCDWIKSSQIETVKGVFALVVANRLSYTSNPTLKDSSQFSQGSLRPLTMKTSLWSDIIGTDLEHHTKVCLRMQSEDLYNQTNILIHRGSSFGQPISPACPSSLITPFTPLHRWPCRQTFFCKMASHDDGQIQCKAPDGSQNNTPRNHFLCHSQQLCYPSRPQA